METTLVKRDGKVSMERSFEYLCSLLRNGEYTVRIVRKSKPRTIPQNSLMWMWFKCMEEATGQSKDDIHEYYKQKFLGKWMSVQGKTVRIAGSTKRLDTVQMSEYMDKIKADAATEFGISLPVPEDLYYQDFIEEYKNKI